jgi:hypothetical protein
VIRTFIEGDLMTIADYRLHRWFEAIEKARKSGYRVVSVRCVRGWIFNSYVAALTLSSGFAVDFSIGPVRSRS